MRKSVKIGKTVYEVRVGEDRIEAEETVYPLSGYSNCYGTEYIIDLNYSKGWAKAEISCWNATWACRGHGMTDSWIESEGYIRKRQVRELLERVKKMLEEAEDKTPDVYNVFELVRNYVRYACDYDDEF